ncbi:hypothetical protein BDQ94DRAFT_148478 [Aspergillus welwitschiae]|uniref:Uncharacterized protein n=1 Tax=Aspergillus welwitschiae TaxID=1341132 RepID=A0A3F3PU78_9EURO|nr:hypothetical protein BDQ94DRAFT_148478 [Aspergillus welwitschiae]RDH30463.1 hypothetical protein BDQ94DRAFT_148478 [Aspergillus welwitschiae]
MSLVCETANNNAISPVSNRRRRRPRSSTSFRTQSLFCSFLVSLRGLNLVRELVTCYYLSWWLLSSVEIRSDH